jgi:alpha-L-arabinofuranosidase
MIHRNPGSLLVESLASGPKSLDVLARKSEDGQALMLQVVNIEASPVNAELLLGGFQPASATATVSVLQAPLDGVNTEDAPEAVAPVTTRWQHNMRNGRARRAFPPFSFTLIRFE